MNHVTVAAFADELVKISGVSEEVLARYPELVHKAPPAPPAAKKEKGSAMDSGAAGGAGMQMGTQPLPGMARGGPPGGTGMSQGGM